MSNTRTELQAISIVWFREYTDGEVCVFVYLSAGEARQLAHGGGVHVRVVAHEQLHAHAGRAARLPHLVVRRRLRHCVTQLLISPITLTSHVLICRNLELKILLLSTKII